jgi:hypothetical protein
MADPDDPSLPPGLPIEPSPLVRFFGPGPVFDAVPATVPETVPVRRGGRGHVWARWIFLRALGTIFFSAFYSLLFQIRGLIGERGILPAGAYLEGLATVRAPLERAWLAPTLLWLNAGDGALTAIVVSGGIASLLLLVNVAPRAMCVACTLLFLSFVAAGQDFADYQSDGMLLEAGFLSAFLAPRGLRPGLAAASPPSRGSVFLLQWEWFRIYFESGVVKLASGDPHWRDLSAMDRYYENGPLPTWIGWYAHQLPHGFHAATALLTLVIELAVVWLLFVGPRARRVCFLVVTPLQIGIILTANYAFLNYIVLFLGVLLLDDDALVRLRLPAPRASVPPVAPVRWRLWAAAVLLSWAFYATVAEFVVPPDVLLYLPARALQPARIANRYGLFAVMTEARYEIELQASTDGVTWVPYRFRYKPEDVAEAPGIYAPYQPRFEWNLWFASLGTWRGNEWVLDAEQRLAERAPAVLALFREDPLHGAQPLRVRAILWQYWFTTTDERRRTGAWWRREERGIYAPVLERQSDGTIGVAAP